MVTCLAFDAAAKGPRIAWTPGSAEWLIECLVSSSPSGPGAKHEQLEIIQGIRTRYASQAVYRLGLYSCETQRSAVRYPRMEAGTFSPIHISWAEASLRIGASMLLPLLIGLDRFLRRKPIDFRPFVIVALAACSLSLTIMELAARVSGPDVDLGLSRVFAGVITGIGFLGAGAMFREDSYVKGAGSAASIWAAGAIGLICGVGLLWLAGMLAGGVLLVLIVSAPFTGKYDAD